MPPSDDGAESFPRRVGIEFSETVYDMLAKEELLTGLNMTTIVNRAVQAYKQMLDAQRGGEEIALINRRYGANAVKIMHWDDPGRHQ